MLAAIRLADPVRDAEAIAAIYAPSVLRSTASFEETPPDAAEMATRLERYGGRYPWLVCERGDGEIAGYAYTSPFNDRPAYRWSANVAVYVSPGHQRAGVGRALYTSLFALLRLQGLHTLGAGITMDNAPSIALHEAFGFQSAALYPSIGFKLGVWTDVGWWLLPLRTPASPTDAPAEVLTLGELRACTHFPPTLASGETLVR